MNAEVDIQQLAFERKPRSAPTGRRPRHLLSRYLIPGALVTGFLALVAWASRDALLPSRQVWVVPVLASQSAAQREGTPLFQAAGWIEPRPTPVRVAALAPGVVERLLVVEDQAVKAGEPVAELVRQDAQLAYDDAVANLKLREAEISEAQAGLDAAMTRFEKPVHLQAVLNEAEATLAEIATQRANLPFETRRAEAQLEFAQGDYQRKQSTQSALAGRTVKDAKRVLDEAEAMVEELRNRAEALERQEIALTERRDALKTQLELRADERQAKEAGEAQLRAAAARLEKARVALAEAQLRLDRITIRAPIDGRVYQLVAYPGTTLTGGMGPIPNADGSTVVTLYRPEMLQARVDVRFADIPQVTLGQAVRINNPALSKPISGKVLFVSSEANIQKNTLEVKVGLDAPQAVFRPEMLVDATFLAPKAAEEVKEDTTETHLYVPRQLVFTDDAGSYVWVADQSESVARKTPVTTGGVGTGGLVEITAGLTPTSRIIARGYESLTDGDRIRVVREEADDAASQLPAHEAEQPLRRLPQGGNEHGTR